MRMYMSTFTWPEWLDDHCRNLTADEKKKFLADVGISKTTLNRWRRGADSPNAANLERMLSILSEGQREQVLLLLRRDLRLWNMVPDVLRSNPPLEEDEKEAGQVSLFQLGLLDSFALKILRIQRDTYDRFYQVSSAVLRKCVETLETRPKRTGLEAVIVKCMPPRQGKVRSMRMLAALGTPPWRGDHHPMDYFLGANSLAGYVATRRHGETIPNLRENTSHIPVQVITEYDRSGAAFPIMRENEVAGVLLVASTEAHFFTPERMALIEIFADLMRLAFRDNASDFYPIADIELGLMPSLNFQRSYFASFRERVEAAYRKASHDESASMRELAVVEDVVREQIEDELLKIAGSEESVFV